MSTPTNRIFSGVQPTQNLHLGNYLGAIRNWVKLQDQFDCIYLHRRHARHHRLAGSEAAAARRRARSPPATSPPASTRASTSSSTRARSPAHAQLAWIFNCVARLGWLNRMTQFKEKAGKDRENASVGLYAYPNLMAADILAYKATHVPVGEDQKQHLELARDIAQKFNNDFGVNFFPLPEPQIFGAATRVMSPARRHQEDEQVGPVGLQPHQHDRRCRDGRAQDPQGQDRSPSPARPGGPDARGHASIRRSEAERPEASTSWASMPRSRTSR